MQSNRFSTKLGETKLGKKDVNYYKHLLQPGMSVMGANGKFSTVVVDGADFFADLIVYSKN